MADEDQKDAARKELARRELERRQSIVPGWLRQGGRQLGLAARAMAQVPVDAASVFANPLAYTMNQGLRLAGSDYRFPADQGKNFEEKVLNPVLPQPQSTPEKIANFGMRVTGGAALGRWMDPAVMSRLGYTPRQPAPPAPTTEALREGAESAYQQADNAGVIVRQQSMDGLAGRIAQRVAKEGFDVDLHPQVAAALRRLSTDAQGDLTFQGLDTLRKVIRNASDSTSKSERRLAQLMINELDDFVGGMGAKDVISGDPITASAAIRQARDLYARASKSGEIQELMTRARLNAPNFSASGLENAIRTEFRRLARNPRRLRLFNATEQAAIRKVAEGGPLENSLRMLGKLAPTGVVSGALSGGMGYAIGGPAGAALTTGTGALSRGGATMMTLRNARIADELMRRGAPVATDFSGYALPAAGAFAPLPGIFGQNPEQ